MNTLTYCWSAGLRLHSACCLQAKQDLQQVKNVAANVGKKLTSLASSFMKDLGGR